MSSDLVESNEDNSLKYVPGKTRSHRLEMMMSKEELEEEQRSVGEKKLQIWVPLSNTEAFPINLEAIQTNNSVVRPPLMLQRSI